MSNTRRSDTFRNEITDAFDLDPDHARIVDQAARILDELALMESAVSEYGPIVQGRYGPQINPALEQADKHRKTFMALLKSLNLPRETHAEIVDMTEAAASKARSDAARKAARARWGNRG
ncbi:hypothetical protein ABZ078_41330 [Streptomyces sp. NPDC006385]|uniref:hypothetical protein n=1 Tax=Streptomyces sp. NPDC006385 TaxID=3156761 RepID=UPI0033B81975